MQRGPAVIIGAVGVASVAIAAGLMTGLSAAGPSPDGGSGSGRGSATGPISSSAESKFLATYCKGSSATAVPTGSEAEARAYYQSLATSIGLSLTLPPAGTTTPSSKLDDVLVYLGYAPTGTASPVTAKQLQDTPPRDLMDPSILGPRLGLQLAAGDVLVARFFAPKISDVSVAKVTDAGWRKLVRLRSQPGSPAANNSIEYGVVLFNFFAPMHAADPFVGRDSVNTQVILVSNDAKRSLYWVDFGKTVDGALLSFSLNAFFDAGHIPSSSPTQGAAVAYHVPCGCISCHGGMRLDYTQTPPAPQTAYTSPLLDYLDTDHWNDRIQAGDDFAGLTAPILFDAGTYDVIQELNVEFERQNAIAQPDSM